MIKNSSLSRKEWIILVAFIGCGICLFIAIQNSFNNRKELSNQKILDKFLNAPLSACNNTTLKESIDTINTYENLSAKYSISNTNNQDVLMLTILSPDDNLIAALTFNENDELIIVDASADSIKQNVSNDDDVSLYSVIAAGKMLCP